MSIKIEIIADNAAEMHKELQALLYGPQGPVIRIPGVSLEDAIQKERGRFVETDSSGVPSTDAEVSTPETAVKTTKNKRRTKAEIEAEKKAEQASQESDTPESEEVSTGQEEDPTADIYTEPEEALNPPAATEKKDTPKLYDINDLRQLAVSKGTSKKPGIANILKKYGVDTFPKLSSDDMQKVYAEIEAL